MSGSWHVYRQRVLKKTSFSEVLVAVLPSRSIWDKSFRAPSRALGWGSERLAKDFLSRWMDQLDNWDPGFIYLVRQNPPLFKSRMDIEIKIVVSSSNPTESGIYDRKGRLKRL